jgi:hypothetical protein
VIVRELADGEGYRVALVSTDLNASAAELIARYTDRWPIEVAFQDAKHVTVVGEARNRVQRAVERTVPFGLLYQTIAITWYALHADPAAMWRAGGGPPPGTPRSAIPRCSTSSPPCAAS